LGEGCSKILSVLASPFLFLKTHFTDCEHNPCLPSNLLPAYLPNLFSQMVSYFLRWFQELEEGEGGRGRGGRPGKQELCSQSVKCVLRNKNGEAKT
jgi:hypothetical protein